MRTHPDIGAVAVHHERQIAEQLDALRVRARACLLPLCAGEPLQVLLEQHLVRTLATRVIDGHRITALQCLGPRCPRPFILAHVQGPKQAVVLEPPGLLADVGVHRAPTRRFLPPFDVAETFERRTQRALLQPPHVVVHEPRRATNGGQRIAILRRQ